MIYAISIIILALIAWFFLNQKQPSDIAKYRYTARHHLMTQREEKVFNLLNQIFGQKFYIIPQMHLSALLDHKVKGQNWKGAFSHINGKSVDFVLLRRTDLSIICAVELDDSTHDTTKRQARDDEINRIFEQARLPLIRLRHPERMSKQEVINEFSAKINA